MPSAFLMIAASFRAMDPSLEEQSAMAGRGMAQTTLRITLPIMRPALLAALIYYIIVVIESFDIPGLLGFTARIRVLSTAIYWATHSEVGLPDYGLASALGAMVLAVALLLMWIYQRLTAHQERFATITGKGYRPRQINLGAWTAPATALCVFYSGYGRGAAVPDADLDQRSAVLRDPIAGIPRASELRGVLQNLAGQQCDARAVEYDNIGAGHRRGDDFLAVLVSWFVVRRGRTADGLFALSRHGVIICRSACRASSSV